MTQEKSFWHKTKEVTGSIWDGTKEVTEDVWEGTKNITEDMWEGTKNVAGGIKNAFTGDDEEDLHEDALYAASADDNTYEDLEIDEEEAIEKPKHHTTKH